jgi:hypothetical protein
MSYKHTSHNDLRNVKEFKKHILCASQDTSYAKHQVTAITKHMPIINAIIVTQSQTRLHCFTVGLTFKNCASHIWDGRTATLQMLHFIYFFNKYKY